MRLVTYQSETGPRVAGVRDGDYVDLQQADAELPSSLAELLAMGAAGRERAAAATAAIFSWIAACSCWIFRSFACSAATRSFSRSSGEVKKLCIRAGAGKVVGAIVDFSAGCV